MEGNKAVKYLRFLLLSIALLFAAVMAVSLLIPSRVRISKAINVKTTMDKVEKQVGDMQRWKDWNPFFTKVADKIVYKDAIDSVPQVMEINGTTILWQQKKSDEYIAAMQRPGKKAVLNGWKSIEHAGTDSLTVQWYMDFQLNWYPWEKLGSILYERIYAANMELGLTNLKAVLEK